jgi:ribosome biogenesis GTPase A
VEDEKEEKTAEASQRHELIKEPGVFTRAELTLQRIETHLLDLSPFSVSAIANDNDKLGQRKTNGDSSPASSVQPADFKKESMTVGETLSTRNIRVAVVGNVDAGKSTMIGTLTSSCLDDGRGSSRTSIMKHRHEIQSGRTSTASTHLMGFRSTGEAISGKDGVRANRRKSEDEVAKESFRVVSLMDLAGHEKYLKTT